jgi:hypothetical protein
MFPGALSCQLNRYRGNVLVGFRFRVFIRRRHEQPASFLSKTLGT